MATTNEALIAWFNDQSIWIKDAVRTYYINGDITDKDIKRFAKECVDEISGEAKDIDLTGLNLLAKDDRQSFAIKAISNVEGVNALVSDRSLEFGINGVTVVYGENGAGKSGYIRILKKLADAKYKEILKENVYVPSKKKQSCEVTVVRNGSENTLKYDLLKDREYPLLKDIDIFDTRISTAYINDANEASYEPWIFSLFGELGNIASKVKSEIERLKGECDSYEISVPEGLEKTKTGKSLLELTSKSKFDENFFSWKLEDEELLENKNKEANLDAIKNKVDSLGKEIVQLSGLINYLKQFEQFFSVNSISCLRESKKLWEEAKLEQKAAQILFEESASNLDKESVSNSAWKALWKDANSYYETILKTKDIVRYTEEQGICPLCGQKIKGPEHVHRMKSIDEYVNGNVSKKVDNAKISYLSLLRRCPKAWEKTQLQLTVDACGLGNEKNSVINCADLIFDMSSRIHSDEIELVEVSTIDVYSAVKLLEEKQKSKQGDKKNNEDLLEDDDHKKLIEDINELRARKYASTIKDRVNNRMEYLQIAKCYDDATKLTGTNKITTKSRLLGEELITEDYVKRFNNELRVLTKGTVKASLKQQKAFKGKVPFRIVLEGVQDEKTSPEDILSEGEKRVVSLAAFFAESSGKNVECPLIVDDPISSLDLKYEALVINRLIEASRHRQVIVFTHRLSMVVGLCDKCGKEIPFVERELLGRGMRKGIPVESAHNGEKSLGKLKNLKNENIVRLKKMDDSTAEYIEGIHYVCQQIRIYVEKSVEDTLLNGIVLRYRKDVQTNNRIKWLPEINQDDCQIVDELMTKYSYYDHSMSDEMPLQEFSLDEIEADLDRMIEWLEGIKKRQKDFK